jgi:hypothetical protein
VRAPDHGGQHDRRTEPLLPALPGDSGPGMNDVEPPPPPGGPAGPPPWPDKVVLRARTATGVSTVGLTRLADDQIRFDPHLNGTCVFAIEHYDLIKVMSRWLV